jgi:hypothetical protein
MTRSIVLGSVVLLALSGVASAQTAKENFSYKAPSGMFSEGTTKWQMYQFMQSDAERMAEIKAGKPTDTGSLSTSSSNGQSYPRPGENSTSERRRTSR